MKFVIVQLVKLILVMFHPMMDKLKIEIVVQDDDFSENECEDTCGLDKDKSSSESEDDYELYDEEVSSDEDFHCEMFEDCWSDGQVTTMELHNNQYSEIIALGNELECSEYEVCSLQLDNELLKQTNDKISTQCSSLTALVQSQAQQILQLKAMYERSVRQCVYLWRYKFNATVLCNDNEKTLIYTVVSCDVFKMLCELLKSAADKPVVPSCSLQDELFYTLVKLRLGLINKDLAYRANINKAAMSKIFHCWITILYRELKQLIIWTETSALRENLPNCFKGRFCCVVCIIDCFEVFIQRPKSFDARAATYSNFKKRNTIKVLIGISPRGSISFISKA